MRRTGQGIWLSVSSVCCLLSILCVRGVEKSREESKPEEEEAGHVEPLMLQPFIHQFPSNLFNPPLRPPLLAPDVKWRPQQHTLPHTHRSPESAPANNTRTRGGRDAPAFPRRPVTRSSPSCRPFLDSLCPPLLPITLSLSPFPSISICLMLALSLVTLCYFGARLLFSCRIQGRVPISSRRLIEIEAQDLERRAVLQQRDHQT